MKSMLIEFLREGDPSEGSINKGRTYLVTAGPEKPARTERMPFGNDEIQEYLFRLRYKTTLKDQQEALTEVSGLITDILKLPPGTDGDPLQLDLVVSVAEIGALPFEAAKDEEGHHLFVDREKVVVPTRRVRGEFEEKQRPWPARPRILFVYANPDWLENAPEVPVGDHENALVAALQPWLELMDHIGGAAIPDAASVLVKKEASLKDIKTAIREVQGKGKPFTHIHILAHGIRIETRVPGKYEYGIALNSEDGKPAKPDELANAIVAQENRPVAVSLAICDGGNETNSAFPVESLAQRLHRGGVPVVVASQLPLTFPGSVVLTREFYGGLLSGGDVRSVLHRTRVSLFEESEEGAHDWLSLVAYVRLPEGYADYREKIPLQRSLASLETASRWAAHLEEKEIKEGSAFDHVTDSLQKRIDALDRSLEQNASQQERKEIREEKTGLLGSANKRLAQFLYVRSKADTDRAEQWLQESHEALKRARDAYFLNWQAHWHGVQYLALQAVISGAIDPQWRWDALLEFAENDAKREEEYWALGSIAELHMLGQIIGRGDGLEAAKSALRTMKERVKDYAKDDFPILSTCRQLRRYQTWWTKENGFFVAQPNDLSEPAGQLFEFLGCKPAVPTKNLIRSHWMPALGLSNPKNSSF